jgi:eukaryotic-like serine/threonine-protein kinase
MGRERWQQIDTIFQAALELAPSERAAFLDDACRGDAALRSEVESLIAHDQAESFMGDPAFKDAARLLARDGRGSLLGRVLGPYEVLEQIGAGGMGEVHLALHTRTNRKVALKLLPSRLIKDEQRARRFQQEARAVLTLNHPNIVTVYDIGQEGDVHFIATEFIEGETLRERMARAPLEMNEALDTAIQVAAALRAAHQAGVVHRDIKPENIMLRPDGYVKVLDFGLAKLTESHGLATASGTSATANIDTEPGLVLGTAKYMSPEQARGLEVDARTDIWSLGVVLYEMVAGRAPFEGATPTDAIISIVEKEPAPLAGRAPEVPARLERIVRKALAKDREERFQSAKDLLDELRSLKRELEIGAELGRPAPPAPTGAAAARRSGGQAAVETARGPAARTAEAETAHATSRAERLAGQFKRHRMGATIVAVTLSLAIATLIYFYSARGDRTPINSIAVLPFVNASADPATEYLSDGLTESLINSLSQLPTLRVMARSTAFSYKGRAVDPQQAGRELGVDAVLMGRVTQRGDALSIQADLVNVADGSQLWGEQYNRRLSDVLAIQQEISWEISERLRLKLTGEEQRRVTRRSTHHTEAYQLYLKGRYHWNKRTDEGAARAIEYFQQAIEKDPAYALAYVGLADSYLVSEPLPAREKYPKAKAAALKALEIDETLGEAHASLAAIKNWYDWDWPGAEAEFRRAIELGPNYPTAHHWYGELLANLGRFDESVAEYQRALEIDPLSLAISTDLGMVYYYARQYDRAAEHLGRVIETDPNYVRTHFYLAQVYQDKGMFEEALAELERGHALDGDSPSELARGKAAIRNGLRASGARGYWRARLDLVKEEARRGTRIYFTGFFTDLAVLHARAGELDQAFEWFDKVHEAREPSLLWLKVAPDCDNLRSDPRFADLLRRVNFPM